MTQYDMIVSLGGNCAAAIQLDLRGLRKYSMPFDYVSMSNETAVSYLLQGFKSHFSDFFLRENMKELLGDERGDDRNGCVQYKDTLSGYRSIHAFKEHVENNPKHYDEIMSTFHRRFDRLFTKISSSKRIAFIIATQFSFDISLISSLQKYLHKQYPGKVIDWYIAQFNNAVTDAFIRRTPGGKTHIFYHTRPMRFDDFASKSLSEWSFMDTFIIADTNLYKKSRYKLPFYLLLALMINLPIIHRIINDKYSKKLLRKINKWWR